MLYAPRQSIPQYHIDAEHMRALEEAVRDCEEDFDVRSLKVYEALDHFQKRTTRSWGFTLFRQGLEDWSPKALHDGLKLIKEHIGYKDHTH